MISTVLEYKKNISKRSNRDEVILKKDYQLSAYGKLCSYFLFTTSKIFIPNTVLFNILLNADRKELGCNLKTAFGAK